MFQVDARILQPPEVLYKNSGTFPSNGCVSVFQLGMRSNDVAAGTSSVVETKYVAAVIDPYLRADDPVVLDSGQTFEILGSPLFRQRYWRTRSA